MCEFGRSRKISHCLLVAAIQIFFLTSCLSSTTVSTGAEDPKKSTTFEEAVSRWNKTQCVYPDESMYKSNPPIVFGGGGNPGPEPVLKRCEAVEKTAPGSGDQEEENFTSHLCQSVYLVSLKLCENNDKQVVSFLQSDLKKSALDKVLDYSLMDVCEYASKLSTDPRSKAVMGTAIKDQDVINKCKKYCYTGLKPICELLISGLWQYSVRFLDMPPVVKKTEVKVVTNPTPAQESPLKTNNITNSPSGDSSSSKPQSAGQEQNNVTTNAKSQDGTPGPADAITKKRVEEKPASTTASSKIEEKNQSDSSLISHKLGIKPTAPTVSEDSAEPIEKGDQLRSSGSPQDNRMMSEKLPTPLPPQQTKSGMSVSVAPNQGLGGEEKVATKPATQQPPVEASSHHPQQPASSHPQQPASASTRPLPPVVASSQPEPKPDTMNDGNGSDHAQDEDYDLTRGSQASQKKNQDFVTVEENVPSSGHFFAYFLTAVVICISGYVIFHNKQKILAFIVEGRSGVEGIRRRNGGNVQYKPLKSNVEEVMPSLDKATSAKNFVY